MISELALRVRRAPRERLYEGLFFEDFAAGVGAVRELAREQVLPDVVRLSDESETRMSLALAGDGGLKGRLGRAYLGLRGYREGCLAILGFEGEAEEVAFRRARALALARRFGGLAVGRSPGEAWRAARFSAPYLRDDLLDTGRDGRDARDGHAVGQPAEPAPPGRAARSRASCSGGARRRW